MNKIYEIDMERVRLLYERGLKILEIAQLYGVSYRCIQYRMEQEGIERRPKNTDVNRETYDEAHYRELKRHRQSRRRARKAGGGGHHTSQQFKDLCESYGNQCLACGSTTAKLQQDHILPISMKGSDDISNIQPLCGPCNRQKGAKVQDFR